jgi:hypothetical protein
VSPLYFLPNHLSDSIFETYLRDTHRLMDYRDVKEQLLPQLFESFQEFTHHRHCRFTCTNRFEGQFPSIRIQSPVGFVPDVIHIEFPNRHESFVVKQAKQESKLQGLENLTNHLRVILMMGLAHWRTT